MKKLTIGILAHVDAGKTTLSETMLYHGGVIKSLGRVDDCTSFFDTDEQERSRGITIFSKQAIINYKDTSLTLLDTPGHVDFSAETERTLSVLDLAILVISGSSGVQSHTLTLWKLLRRYNVPVILFINKMDMPGTDKNKLLDGIKNKLSGDVVEFSSGVIIDYDTLATCSEKLLEEYLNTGSISQSSVSDAILGREVFPCFFGSALRDTGVEALMEFINMYSNSKLSSEQSPFGAYCYKITRDEKNVRLSHIKIFSGQIKVKEMLEDEKINELRLYNGTGFTSLKEASAGDIVAIPGLENTLPGKGFGTVKGSLSPALEPVLSYAVRYPDEFDNTRIMNMLTSLEEELPELHVVYDEEHREIRLCLMGAVQTEIITELVKKKFNVAITFDVGSISYKETITDTVEGVGHYEPLRHYAEVHLRLEPAEPGSGLIFDSELSEDLLDRNWQRLIRTHLEERIHRGVLTGSPITDMKITLVGGRAHNKHTEGGDFRQATYRAVRQGLMQAHSRLLEPYYNYTLIIPESCIGRAMTDIDRMNGTFTLEETKDGTAVINGNAPVSTMHTYINDVIAYTHGEGQLFLSVGGYFPCHNEEEVITEKGYNPDSDTRNPSASVFCMHGAGTTILWNEVFDYMHIPSCIEGQKSDDVEGIRPIAPPPHSFQDLSIGTDEIDEIIQKTANSNSRPEARAHKGISKERALERRTVSYNKPAPEVVYKGSSQKKKYLLVDGYNVIFAWTELKELAQINIDSARDKLLDIMCSYQSITGEEVIVVFDAYRLFNHPVEYADYNNIHYVYTRTAQTADMYIEHFAHENSKHFDITVATSDGLEQIITRGNGCMIVSSRELERKVEEIKNTYNEIWAIKPDDP